MHAYDASLTILMPLTTQMKTAALFGRSFLFYMIGLLNLLSVRASFSQSGPSSSWLAKHDITVSAQDNGLSMAENSGNLEASRALNVHKE